MPDLYDVIRQRRSIRSYQSKPVPKEVVQTVLETVAWAPSAHNSQPWRFIVLEDAQVKRDLAEQMADVWAIDVARDNHGVDAKTRSERVERFAGAPVLILACLTMEGLRKFSDEVRQSIERDLAVASLGAGIQNLLLVAHAIGLGTCWYCAPAFCRQLVQETLKIPKHVEPHAFIILGYPDEQPSAPPRKKVTDYCFIL
ncbi:nitroreductase family protein [Candidatus Bathycorpusculum sp.]|uniref:nitroreductase family protein n=1 Tax=Candidatus Bathycorpusculum sp. TaxID=2994959 RepID=UPI00283774E2|nr:nitroreductase family protein [Candidatus Termitimicrobium sp.]